MARSLLFIRHMAKFPDEIGSMTSEQLATVSGGWTSPESCMATGEWIGEGVRTATYWTAALGYYRFGPKAKTVEKGLQSVIAGGVANTAESLTRTAAKTAWWNHVCGQKGEAPK